MDWSWISNYRWRKMKGRFFFKFVFRWHDPLFSLLQYKEYSGTTLTFGRDKLIWSIAMSYWRKKKKMNTENLFFFILFKFYFTLNYLEWVRKNLFKLKNLNNFLEWCSFCNVMCHSVQSLVWLTAERSKVLSQHMNRMK